MPTLFARRFLSHFGSYELFVVAAAALLLLFAVVGLFSSLALLVLVLLVLVLRCPFHCLRAFFCSAFATATNTASLCSVIYYFVTFNTAATLLLWMCRCACVCVLRAVQTQCSAALSFSLSLVHSHDVFL